MELPHWLMVVGALFLVFGLFGLALRKNVQVTSKPNNRDDDADTQSGLPNPPSVISKFEQQAAQPSIAVLRAGIPVATTGGGYFMCAEVWNDIRLATRLRHRILS